MLNKLMIINNEIHIGFDFTKGNTQIIDVMIQWNPISESGKFSIPIWTPGSYTVRDYSQFISNVQLEQNGSKIKLSSEKVGQWKFQLKSLETLKLQYQVEARTLTVRNSYIDQNFASICMATMIMLVDNHRYSKHILHILKPRDWNLYLNREGIDSFEFIDYDHIIDTPVQAGSYVERIIDVKGFKHRLVINSDIPLEVQTSFFKDITDICETTCDLLKTTPPSHNNYLIVIYFIDNAYGGLEHDNCCILHFSKIEMSTQKGYSKLLSLVAHEYFHQWNVRRLRPKEYISYDYEYPVLSSNLWFAEGITSYFDLSIPLLACKIKYEDYLKNLTTDITTYLTSQGKSVQSPSASSREAWVKLYKADKASRNSQMSYYLSGKMIALCLDIYLREYNSSLIEILRNMYSDKKILKEGYTRDDILKIVAIVNSELSENLSCWLDIPDNIPVREALSKVGLRLNRSHTNTIEHGLHFQNLSPRLIVIRVDNASYAQRAGITVNDEIIAVDKVRINTPDDFNSVIKEKGTYHLSYFRFGQLHETVLNVESEYKFSLVLEPLKEISQSQQDLLNSWKSFI